MTKEKKPYDRCLHCEKRGEKCDGPRTSAMALSRWCEFMRDMKEINKMTYAEISRISGVSLRTIEKILSGKLDQDIMRETARLIENAIIGSSNQYPCYMAFMESLPPETKRAAEIEAEMAELRKNIALLHESYNAELVRVREEEQRKIDYLKSECEKKDKLIAKLAGIT